MLLKEMNRKLGLPETTPFAEASAALDARLDGAEAAKRRAKASRARAKAADERTGHRSLLTPNEQRRAEGKASLAGQVTRAGD